VPTLLLLALLSSASGPAGESVAIRFEPVNPVLVSDPVKAGLWLARWRAWA
jgi:hypothetical protein